MAGQTETFPARKLRSPSSSPNSPPTTACQSILRIRYYFLSLLLAPTALGAHPHLSTPIIFGRATDNNKFEILNWTSEIGSFKFFLLL